MKGLAAENSQGPIKLALLVNMIPILCQLALRLQLRPSASKTVRRSDG